MDPRSTLELKLRVKPVFIALHHDYVYEGPCRFESKDELKTEYDLKVNDAAYAQFLKDLDEFIPAGIELLDPAFIDRNEEFLIQEEDLAKIAEDDDTTDAYLIGEKGRGYDMIVEFAQRIKKPILLAENALYSTITMAALLARGLEVYPTLTWQDIGSKLRVLRVRKALKESRVLLAPKGNSNISLSTTDSFLSLERVTEKFGVRFRYVDAHELLDQTRCVPPAANPTLPGRNGLNPNGEDLEEISKLTGDLISGAVECDMKEDDVFNSVKAFHTVKKLMEHHQCNAFSMPCPDVCATRRLNEEKITFCLTHSLNNERGMPSACEYDIPAAGRLLGDRDPGPAGNLEQGGVRRRHAGRVGPGRGVDGFVSGEAVVDIDPDPGEAEGADPAGRIARHSQRLVAVGHASLGAYQSLELGRVDPLVSGADNHMVRSVLGAEQQRLGYLPHRHAYPSRGQRRRRRRARLELQGLEPRLGQH